MLNYKIDEFDKPVREIKGKVEVGGATKSVTVKGEVISVNDVSSTPHTVDLKCENINLVEQKGLIQLRDTPIIVESNKYLYVGVNRLGQASGRATVNEYTDNKITFTSILTWWGIGFMIKISPNTDFFVSASMPSSIANGLTYYDENKTFISQTLGNKGKTPPNCAFLMITFLPKNAEGIKVPVTIEKIQIVLGSIQQPYTPHIGDFSKIKVDVNGTLYTPKPNGVVDNVKSVSPVMNITAPNGGVIFTATYKKDVTGAIYSYDDHLQSFKIEREGESGKYFGFGVSQKLTLNLLDKDRKIKIAKGTHLKAFAKLNEQPYLDFAPKFTIETIKRNENNNNLEITGYDDLYRATGITYGLRTIDEPTIKDYALKCGEKLGLGVEFVNIPTDDALLNKTYPGGGNFDGNETVREMLDMVAEAIQAVYYITPNGNIRFKRLDRDGKEVLQVNKSAYFTLDNKGEHTLSSIWNVTELGDNVKSNDVAEGEPQYVRNNGFWDIREDIVDILTQAINNIGGIFSNTINLSWRGNFALEPTDKMTVIGKDNVPITFYNLNDSIEYSGGLKGSTKWEFKENEAKTEANPVGLGEKLNLTFARVDKANQNIELLVQKVNNNSEQLSSLKFNADEIRGTVQEIQKEIPENIENLNGAMSELTNKVETKMTSEEVEFLISSTLANGTDKVITSDKKFTFDDNGLKISQTDGNIDTSITENGMTINRGGTAVLVANDEGVQAEDLHATTYLIIGRNSRFEDFNTNRTGCFWIGG